MTPRRTGFSLIETLVAMAMSAVMVTVASTTITLMMRSERTGADALIAAQSGHRLERRFRDDVHAAAAAVVDTSDSSHPLLRLAGNGQPGITWSRVKGGLRRTVGNPPSHVDTFRLSATEVVFTLSSAGPPSRRRQLVTITAIPETDSEPLARDAWPTRLTTVLNRDGRPVSSKPEDTP
tara:strand:- start:3550 stop:4086 length:537 start_codon:yes stop_codon:yes gene_type:complete